MRPPPPRSYLSESKPKTVTFHLAQISDHGRVVLGTDSLQFGWFDPTMANERVLYLNMQDVLRAAGDHIRAGIAEREREVRLREQRERELPMS